MFDNERTRLTPDEINEIIFLYTKLGWKEAHIARKLLKNKATVRWHIIKRKLEREVPQVTAIPLEILYTYDDELADVPQTESKTYDDYVQEEKQRKQAKCNHFHWVKRCSHCNMILETEKTHIHKVRVQRDLSTQNDLVV